ncbi:MAG: SOS response-associated peptidase family protein, partial [Pseudohongiellaceae bacterium]
IELQKSAIAFGGLYKEYFKRETGEIVYSASIITLPPLVPQWNEIHPNSMPLMLDFEDEELADKWLDPNFHEVEEFKSLLVNHVQKDMVITRVGRPSKWNPIADSFIIRR